MAETDRLERYSSLVSKTRHFTVHAMSAIRTSVGDIGTMRNDEIFGVTRMGL